MYGVQKAKSYLKVFSASRVVSGRSVQLHACNVLVYGQQPVLIPLN